MADLTTPLLGTVLVPTAMVVILLGFAGVVQRKDRSPPILLVLLGAFLLGAAVPTSPAATAWLVILVAVAIAWATLSASVWVHDAAEEQAGDQADSLEAVHPSTDRPPLQSSADHDALDPASRLPDRSRTQPNVPRIHSPTASEEEVAAP